ncbi:uridine kinase family protein [Cellulomonas endophytica]|uniref:uridine kinase family protein n=1 Tax=Cellulomonas endophytica TaxID=2494735 RepID=UPI00196A887E|nr:hypothetical protein [Cellulomonas endophytica]
MPMLLPTGEPAATGWRVVDEAALVARVLEAAGEPAGRPRVVAVDGRGGAGKSTLARRLAAAVPSTAVVHTDDLAWHEAFFGWGHLLQGLLEAVHRDGAGRLRPPAWERRGRPGAVEVPAGTSLVVVEGTGASHREHAHLLDATVWVQSDAAEAERRAIDRDVAQGVNGDRAAAVAFWDEWMAHELPFFAAQRPWERAALVVAGTAPGPLPEGAIAVVAGPLPAAA